MTTETLDKYTWFVTLIREKGCSCYAGSGENYTRHEISQVIIKCNNEKDVIQKSLEFINLKRPRESITTEPEPEPEYGFEIKTPLTKYLLGIPVEEIEKSMKENPHKSALSIAIEKSMKEKPHIAASEPEPEPEYGFEIKTPLTKYLLGIPVEEIEKSMKEKPHIAASEPINTSEDWTILFNDSLSKYSIIKCDFPIEESMEFCYSDLNEFD
jgi:hypothetical protein